MNLLFCPKQTQLNTAACWLNNVNNLQKIFPGCVPVPFNAWHKLWSVCNSMKLCVTLPYITSLAFGNKNFFPAGSKHHIHRLWLVDFDSPLFLFLFFQSLLIFIVIVRLTAGLNAILLTRFQNLEFALHKGTFTCSLMS